jgi:hypothetical protein
VLCRTLVFQYEWGSTESTGATLGGQLGDLPLPKAVDGG